MAVLSAEALQDLCAHALERQSLRALQQIAEDGDVPWQGYVELLTAIRILGAAEQALETPGLSEALAMSLKDPKGGFRAKALRRLADQEVASKTSGPLGRTGLWRFTPRTLGQAYCLALPWDPPLHRLGAIALLRDAALAILLGDLRQAARMIRWTAVASDIDSGEGCRQDLQHMAAWIREDKELPAEARFNLAVTAASLSRE